VEQDSIRLLGIVGSPEKVAAHIDASSDRGSLIHVNITASLYTRRMVSTRWKNRRKVDLIPRIDASL
jgi:hypothetical protein